MKKKNGSKKGKGIIMIRRPKRTREEMTRDEMDALSREGIIDIEFYEEREKKKMNEQEFKEYKS